MKNKNFTGVIVNNKKDLAKVRDHIIKPNEQQKTRTVKTLKNTFAKIGIKQNHFRLTNLVHSFLSPPCCRCRKALQKLSFDKEVNFTMENFDIQRMLNTVATTFKDKHGKYSVAIYLKARENPVIITVLSFVTGVNESQSTGVLRVLERSSRDYYHYIPVKNIDYVRVHKDQHYHKLPNSGSLFFK